ncbi:MmcQ/YjbR family DNA-binding protein [soil metagenome]
MDIVEVREYCLNKKSVEEGMPFGEGVLVYKVCNKIFLLIPVVKPYRMNVKCDPEIALELREKYEDVQPGYHMNKVHWNTVFIEGKISKKEILKMIDDSYMLIVKSLKVKDRKALGYE